MSYVEKTGDLFTSDADAYAHGVNVDGLMGAGIAVQFRKRWPEMYTAYKALCQISDLRPGDVWVWNDHPNFSSLGCVRWKSEVDKRAAEIAALPKPKWIYNIASQDRPGANARLDWFEHGLKEAINHAEDHDVRSIAMPRIGCGIGGLKWTDVKEVLEFFAKHTEVAIEVWEFAQSETPPPTDHERLTSLESRVAKLESRPTGFERY